MVRGDGTSLSGLSPRVRGNPRLLARPVSGDGSIPACAGEPPRWQRPGATARVYPRVCGGTRRCRRRLGSFGGLSPRVRGNRPAHHRRLRRGGSIPACAGEPCPAGRPVAGRRVYPRVCGGTDNPENLAMSDYGLSPRVRGNHQQSICCCALNGSIPACAGEPCGPVGIQSSGRVYPRVCGGTPRPPPGWLSPAGLSPRVRGNLSSVMAATDRAGSIPACAGEPSGTRGIAPPPPVYPRVCGGTRARFWAILSIVGLSPRVRGNPSPGPAVGATTGSIPACAGEPIMPPAPVTAGRVYPRVCGGTERRAIWSGCWGGLSPRVRGNLGCILTVTGCIWSIPACAGEPLR